MTATLDRHLFEHALGAAGFERGERFEVFRVSAQGARGIRTADPQQALRFVGRDPVNVYLGLNPIKPDADPPHGKAREEDVAIARVLNVDCDPDDVSPEARTAARELALEVRAWLEELGVRAPLIDSGRGHQLWLRHEPIAVEACAEIRQLFLRGLAHRFRRAGAHVDEAPYGARFAGRLVGTTNGKTQERVRIVDPGDGRVLSWGTMVELAARWRAELPPPPEGPRKIPPEVQKILEELPGRPDAWRWLGACAARAGGLHDALRPAVPRGWEEHFDEGARHPRRRWQRPLDDAFVKRCERAMASLLRRDERASKVARAREDLEIVSITRYTEGPGRAGWIDLELRVGDSVFHVRRLDGKEVLSYAAVRARAALQGALLPDLEKEARSVWDGLLRPAWSSQKVELVREGTTHAAVMDAIRETLRQAKVGRNAGDFVRGHLIQLGEQVAIYGHELVAHARTRMQPDVVSREQVLEAARDLGCEPGARPVLPDGSRRRAWVFPARVLQTQDD